MKILVYLLLKIVIFHCQVSFREGNMSYLKRDHFKTESTEITGDFSPTVYPSGMFVQALFPAFSVFFEVKSLYIFHLMDSGMLVSCLRDENIC